MCGRFTQRKPPSLLIQTFRLDRALEQKPRYNIAPSQAIAAVRIAPQDQARELAPLRWGFVPHWAKDLKTGYSMINARLETVSTKPAFRSAFKHRRCLIPADGYYEWQTVGKRKQPYFIRQKDEGLFAFAGLWEHWGGNEGESVESCTIIVTDANEALRYIHDRMPVILDPQDYDRWLDPDTHDPAALLPLLRSAPAEQMVTTPVSPRVNSPRNEDEGCITPVALPEAQA
jgi:putative SOS response-associated peptidase YedK